MKFYFPQHPKKFSTLAEILRWRALTQPSRVAYTFLADGEVDARHLTYAELDRQARAIAALLENQNARTARVLLLYPQGLEFIAALLGCFYSGTVAVPAYPPDPARLNRTLPRLQAIAADAQSILVLTTSQVLSVTKEIFSLYPDLEKMRWLATDNLPVTLAEEWRDTLIDGEDLAFLQYTSGSTATPKGVMITHNHILHNAAYYCQGWQLNSDSVAVTWLPSFHDLGLMDGITAPLFLGYHSVLMSPLAFLQKPLRWLKAITNYRGTYSAGPNFAFDLCARKISSTDKQALDLSSWNAALIAAEPVRKETMTRFIEAFSQCRFDPLAFCPGYGLAEATLKVTATEPTAPVVYCTLYSDQLAQHSVVIANDEQNTQTLVSSGNIENEFDVNIIIVDPESLTELPHNRVGEIWVSSPSLGQGYWRRPEETKKTFRAYLADSRKGPFLRTGDLGFVKDKELFITGRIKDLIIIDGRNHYPQDIELTVERSSPLIRPGCTAAFSIDINGQEELVIAAEVEPRRHQDKSSSQAQATFDWHTVINEIKQNIAEYHDLAVKAVLLLKAGTIPKTSSGKIQRHACRNGFNSQSLELVDGQEWSQQLELEKPVRPTVVEQTTANLAAIRGWLVNRLSEQAKLSPEKIDIRRPFHYYGLRSVEAVNLSGELAAWLGIELSPTLLYEHTSIETLSSYLAGQSASVSSKLITQTSLEGGEKRELIAIVGIGCRLPGAENPSKFWQLLRQGVDAVHEVPTQRWDINAFYNPDQAAIGKATTRWGGFLTSVDRFDAGFFGISPREAACMDPQQRLLLELVWEALEDAGEVCERLAGTNTGVFVGIGTFDYGRMQLSNIDLCSSPHASTGSCLSIAANRISYIYNFLGPSVAIDTACSSSLVAVHLACQSIYRGESTLALAGGVNLILDPNTTISMSKGGYLSADGKCKAFDARANGYVRGEGGGIVVLKPLSTALAEGNPIYAVIRGSAINQDGRTNGLTAPNQQSQEALLQQAYKCSAVSPAQVQYVEAHGTGTALGDPIEVKALGAVLSIDRQEGDKCIIGSVKTNIGHLEAAAGIAGLIKVALSLKNGEIPASLHFETPNPYIPFNDLPIVVQQRLSKWPERKTPAIAGVSSFGFGGTNAHIVLQAAPERVSEIEKESADINSAYLLPLSAHTPEALKAMAESYTTFLANSRSYTQPALRDICYSAGLHRSHLDYRLSMVGHSKEELIAHLTSFCQQENSLGFSVGQRHPNHSAKIVFVFPGQGSQWFGMGRQLLEKEPVFRQTLAECDQAMRTYIDWSLLTELSATETESRLNEIDRIQPVLFAIQVALVALWRSWGIEPDAVVGQSMGEVAAAYVAGALNLADAARIICQRSLLLRKVRGQGSMAVVELSMEEVQSALVGYEDRVSIAVNSSPQSTVISGDSQAIAELIASLKDKEVFCRLVKVDVASHSPQMQPLCRELWEVLADVQSKRLEIPLYSSVTGKFDPTLELDAHYWVKNLREPVLFSSAIQQLLAQGHNIFIELSPHPILLNTIAEGLKYAGKEATLLWSLRREEDEQVTILNSLATLYCLGAEINWQQLYPSNAQFVKLPLYPWQRERLWLEFPKEVWGKVKKTPFYGIEPSTTQHPLLTQYLRPAKMPNLHIWEMELTLESCPYLKDHQVNGMALFPATGYIDMALATAEAIGTECCLLERMEFVKPLFLAEHKAQTIQLVITTISPAHAQFQFFSLQSDKQQQPLWDLHAQAMVRFEPLTTPTIETISIAEIKSRCSEFISGQQHYQLMNRLGLEYGHAFQGVEKVWQGKGEAIAQLRVPEGLETSGYYLHPAILDACFQTLSAALFSNREQNLAKTLYLPISLANLRVNAQADRYLYSYIRFEMVAGSNDLKGDLIVTDERGQVLVKAAGLCLRQLEQGMEKVIEGKLNDYFYKISWEAQKRTLLSSRSDTFQHQGYWLVFADNQGVASRLVQQLAQKRGHFRMVTAGPAFKLLPGGDYQLNPGQPQEFEQLIKSVASQTSSLQGVIFLWGLERVELAEEDLAGIEMQSLRSLSLIYLLQALAQAGWRNAPRLWVVTNGVQAIENSTRSLAQSLFWGIGRTIMHEQSQFQCTMIDLSATIESNEIESLFEEIWFADDEQQIALRGQERFVARLVHTTAGADAGVAKSQTSRSAIDQPFRLEISKPGILDHMLLRATKRRPPAAGEVEIEVYTAGLNFVDVMRAMGVLQAMGIEDARNNTIEMGNECAGKIVAIGEGVDNFQIGDEVVAIASGCLGSFVTTSSQLVVLKPAHLSFPEAASLPIAFLTAHHALNNLARMGCEDRVLIHSATGGVGLAAIQLAQQAGAEIFATAGSPEKRQLLETLGVKHIFDSRSLAFADEIMQQTNGKGVDIVLNCLTGEALEKNLAILAPYGRFIEIGKRDIYQNSQLELGHFRRNLCYFAVDLARMVVERPAQCGNMLRELMKQFSEGILRPLPYQCYMVSQVVTAFQQMAQAKHIGKLVINLKAADAPIVTDEQPMTITSDATYLITGGTGGLGLVVAEWLAEQGAKQLVLAARNEASTAALQVVRQLRDKGVEVKVVCLDIACQQQLANLLVEIEQTLPPLKGIVHAAGILSDTTLLKLSRESFQAVIRPKVMGSWNLHKLTIDKELDFLILFSSIASILGSPGQGNYCAANAFLDALAHYRQGEHLAATSLNWGPWSEVGLAATTEKRGNRLEFRGISSINPNQGKDILSWLLNKSAFKRSAQIGIMAFDLRQWRQFYPKAAQSALLIKLAQEQIGGTHQFNQSNQIRSSLLQLKSMSQRKALLESHLRTQIAHVLRISPTRINADSPLQNLGIDSLMALELRNRLEASLGLILPATLIWAYPNLSVMVPYLASKMGICLEAEENTVPLREENIQLAVEVRQLAELSEQEAERLLLEKLASLNRIVD
ncbi:MAG: SDR family NAD(P)-dependent oxidoreductase [Acidobacteriota bacterium]